MRSRLRRRRAPNTGRLFGKWPIKGGVTVLYLGDNLKAINDGDQVIGTLGLAFAY